MKKIFIFFAIFFVFTVNLFAQSAITKSDYEIYAEILRDLRREDIIKNKTEFSFVILSTTGTGTNAPEIYKEKKYAGLNKDFERRNSTPLSFKKVFPVDYKYELAEKTEIESLLGEGKKETQRLKAEEKKSKSFQRDTGWSEVDWKYFNEKYPKSNGYYKFSGIGYSRNKRFAVVTIEGKGTYWSGNIEYLFEKIGNKWVIKQAGGGLSVA